MRQRVRRTTRVRWRRDLLREDGFLSWERVILTHFSINRPYIERMRTDRRGFLDYATRKKWSWERYKRGVKRLYQAYGWLISKDAWKPRRKLRIGEPDVYAMIRYYRKKSEDERDPDLSPDIDIEKRWKRVISKMKRKWKGNVKKQKRIARARGTASREAEKLGGFVSVKFDSEGNLIGGVALDKKTGLFVDILVKKEQ